MAGEPERLTDDDLLDFVGIAPATVLAIPKSQQFAEKVHAYTFSWGNRLNTRTKDLVDLVLLIERGGLAANDVRAAIEATFRTRATHAIPSVLAPPPNEWAIDFAVMAVEANLSTADSVAAFAILERYWITNALGE